VPEGAGFGRVLEVGAGTGFFLINLALGGCLDGAELHATDLSDGMLDVCRATALEHGLDITTRQGDAEALPYEDASFDLVIGHAFIHHLPVPGTAIAEMARVLKPGGTLVIAGEPTELGDKAVVGRQERHLADLPGGDRRARPQGAAQAVDHRVRGDRHRRGARPARARGGPAHLPAEGRGEDRTAGRAARGQGGHRGADRELGRLVGPHDRGRGAPGLLGPRWAFAAFHSYLWLHRFDDEVLARFVPRELFYNLILYARKPYGR
jgi:SAM-dependent methyltransferase